MMKTEIDIKKVDRFLAGKTSPEETVEILAAISVNPKLEEYVVTQKRLNYAGEQLEDYGCFIPAGSMAADDGKNLCDLQCEAFILKNVGVEVSEEDLAHESRMNYWLRGQGTPLFNMGKLLESKGYLVNRIYNADIEAVTGALEKGYFVIAVVNGAVLSGTMPDMLSDDFNLDDDPNHAVVVTSVSGDRKTVSIFNPVETGYSEVGQYALHTFEDAWSESRHYMVQVRKKKFPEEYIPQPVDVSDVELSSELRELTEMIAENAHDVWADSRMKEGWTYGKERNDAEKKNPDLLPYGELPESEKEYDRLMAIHTIKLVKRLGYRLVNITSMYKCPACGDVIEPDYNFCPNCGHKLSWKDFR